jgi:hypothetical protein
VNVQPIHLDWIGDLTAPSWLPFTSQLVPNAAQRNLDVFNAIAIQLQGEAPEEGDFAGFAGDVCVLVLKAPIQEGVSSIVPIIPLP